MIPILESIQRDTPKIVKRLRQAIIYTLAGSLAFARVISSKLGMDPVDYAEWAGIIMLGTKGISVLFGVSDDEAVANAQTAVDKATKILDAKKETDEKG